MIRFNVITLIVNTDDLVVTNFKSVVCSIVELDVFREIEGSYGEWNIDAVFVKCFFYGDHGSSFGLKNL
jgi:hypothetical protein